MPRPGDTVCSLGLQPRLCFRVTIHRIWEAGRHLQGPAASPGVACHPSATVSNSPFFFLSFYSTVKKDTDRTQRGDSCRVPLQVLLRLQACPGGPDDWLALDFYYAIVRRSVR